jgi:hypothetical protein
LQNCIIIDEAYDTHISGERRCMDLSSSTTTEETPTTTETPKGKFGF